MKIVILAGICMVTSGYPRCFCEDIPQFRLCDWDFIGIGNVYATGPRYNPYLKQTYKFVGVTVRTRCPERHLFLFTPKIFCGLKGNLYNDKKYVVKDAIMITLLMCPKG